MREFWTILIINMMYTRLQNYTKHCGGWRTWNIIIRKCGHCVVNVVVYLIVSGPTSAHPLLFLNKWFFYLPNILHFWFSYFSLPKCGCLAMVASEYRRCTISLVLCALQAYGAWTVDMCHIKLCKSITMLDFHVSLVDSSCLGLMACLNQRAWHLNDHGTPHFGWGHREVHGL